MLVFLRLMNGTGQRATLEPVALICVRTRTSPHWCEGAYFFALTYDFQSRGGVVFHTGIVRKFTPALPLALRSNDSLDGDHWVWQAQSLEVVQLQQELEAEERRHPRLYNLMHS